MSELIELSPLFRVSRPVRGGRAIDLFAGQGSDRERLEIDDAGLVSWLLSLRGARPRPELEHEVRERLRLHADDAAEAVDLLLQTAVLVGDDEAARLRCSGRRWEEWGWRDAFDFHWAAYGLQFDKADENYYATLRDWMEDTGEVGPQPGPYKDVDGPAAPLPPVPEASRNGASASLSMGGALLANAPVNYYVDARISSSDLATFLRRSFAVQREVRLFLGPHLLTPSPSGGARHPAEVYVAARNVDGLEPGLYHYHPGHSSLVRTSDLPEDADLAASGYHKRGVETAPALVYLTCRWPRHGWKYRYARTYRMVLMELGHMVQAPTAKSSRRSPPSWPPGCWRCPSASHARRPCAGHPVSSVWTRPLRPTSSTACCSTACSPKTSRSHRPSVAQSGSGST
jgi:SagB-type dehydrogenase family enzyme